MSRSKEHVWKGNSGNEYAYSIHPLDATFETGTAGNFIYAAREGEGRWVALYIGQSSNLGGCLIPPPTLLQMQEFVTHLHVRLSGGDDDARSDEKNDLIAKWKPGFND